MNTGIYGLKLVIAIAKYQWAKILPIRAHCSICIENVMNYSNLKIIEK